VKSNLTMDKIMTRQAFENAIKVNAAIGGVDQCSCSLAGDGWLYRCTAHTERLG
jgi:hypothetical protein